MSIPRAATGFGYLHCGAKPVRGRSSPVLRFVEKPDLATARKFLRSGRYLWNAGMFVWKVGDFQRQLLRHAPRIHGAVRDHLNGHPRAWARATRLSIDYALMERADAVRLVPLDAGWDDVGSWDAAARLRSSSGGAREANRLLLDSPDSVVIGGKRMVALLEAPGLVVVDTPDALLVVSRGAAERVREVVAELRRRGRTELL